MKTKFKFICIIPLLLIFNKVLAYEIIRDPIFEDYINDLSEELKLKKIDVFLINNDIGNAFVIQNNIYFTTGLFKFLNYEDTLKAIYLHEYAHVIKNHFEAKTIKIQQSSNKSNIYNLFSFGLAVLTTNTNIVVGAPILLNNNFINEVSKHSINFEIEADNFMIEQIKKNKINTLELISFLNKSAEPSNRYFRTHPNKKDRINILKKINFKRSKNSEKFEWIKSKYSNNSNEQSFNLFFENLEKGIFNQNEKLNKINKLIVYYEAFKKGIPVENWENDFRKLLIINENPFLKIEYFNYLLDNNLNHKYQIIEDFKYDNQIMSEYFYYYIYGKYYNKIENNNLSNFYFCQFYNVINLKNKADFFCEKYDIKDIPTLDKSYALFK